MPLHRPIMPPFGRRNGSSSGRKRPTEKADGLQGLADVIVPTTNVLDGVALV